MTPWCSGEQTTPPPRCQGQVVDKFLSDTHAMLDLSFWPQILRAKMFQTGGLIVFCGLLAQTMAQFGGLPVPLDQTLPLNVNPALPLSPTGLAGSLTNGEYVTTSFRGVCVRVCVCVCVYNTEHGVYPLKFLSAQHYVVNYR